MSVIGTDARSHMRIAIRDEDDAEVPLSPLIDCVFLLLIFFLVTTMIKFKEKQIPVTLPDPTSSLSEKANSEVFIIGIDEAGAAYKETGRGREGEVIFAPVPDLAVFLKELAATRDKAQPLQISADRDTPFQKVIDAIDLAQLQGFQNVEAKTRQRKE